MVHAIRTVTTGVIAMLAWSGSLHLWAVYALLVINGAASGVFSPATYSILPRLVAESELEAANSLRQTTQQFAMVIGAPIGGALVALMGPALARALNAVSFAVAAVATLTMAPMDQSDGVSTANPSATGVIAAARDGLAYVRGQSWLVALLVLDAVLSFAIVGQSIEDDVPRVRHVEVDGRVARRDEGGFAVRAVAKAQPSRIKSGVAPQQHTQEAAPDGEVQPVALETQALTARRFVVREQGCQPAGMWRCFLERCLPDVQLASVQRPARRVIAG